MKSETFDKKFDDGEDVSKYLDFANATRPDREQKRGKAGEMGTDSESISNSWIFV